MNKNIKDNHKEKVMLNFIERNKLFIFDDKYDISQEVYELIYNEKNTIVNWADGTKTVVKTADGDEFDYEFGFAMAIAQKLFGSRSRFSKFVKNSAEKSILRKQKETNKKVKI